MSEEVVVEQPVTPETPAESGATPAAPADPAPAPKEGEQPPEAKTADPPEKRETPRWLQKQIDKATRLRYQEKARADFLAAELEKVRSQKPALDPGAPTLEQHNFDQAAHAAAVEKFYSEKAAREFSEKQRAQAHQQTIQRIASEWEKKADRGSEKYDDFDQVVGNMEPVNEVIAAVMECDNAEDVAYYLAKNPQDAQRIAAMDARSAIRAIGKLEAKLLSEPPKAKTPSKAPAPIAPVGGKSGGASDLPQDSDDINTWMKKENARMKKQASMH